MKIYLLTQDLYCGYDTYDSMVVIADNEDEAREMHPNPKITHASDGCWIGTDYHDKEIKIKSGGWVGYDDLDKIKITCIGIANPDEQRRVIISSFHAG